MTKKTFVATESDIGKRWEEKLEDSMKQAAEEEKELAIEQNSYHEGIPSISVIVDAGWSKRSHKHSYNAKSGVGIIIEMKNKKLLHLNESYHSRILNGAQHRPASARKRKSSRPVARIINLDTSNDSGKPIATNEEDSGCQCSSTSSRVRHSLDHLGTMRTDILVLTVTLLANWAVFLGNISSSLLAYQAVQRQLVLDRTFTDRLAVY